MSTASFKFEADDLSEHEIYELMKLHDDLAWRLVWEKAVLAEATSKIEGFRLDSKQISGIDRKTIPMVKLYAAGKLQANFLEVMACPGGCEHGPCSMK